MTVPEKRWHRERSRPYLPGVPRRPGFKGNGKESASLDHPRAALPEGGGPRLRPPGERRARGSNPQEGRSGLSLAPASLRCDYGRPLSPQQDIGGSRGPSVSSAASPLPRPPAPPAAPSRAGQCREDRPSPSPHHPSPGVRKSGYLARGVDRDTTQRRKMRRKRVASGPGRFGKFGRLVPHWVTAVRCARAPGPRRLITPPLLTLPSRGW